MKTGDLVACRFDDSVEIGIITGPWKGSEHAFIYASGRQIHTNNLPRSRLIQLRTRDYTNFTNLCELEWDEVEVKDNTFGNGVKLRSWITAVIDEALGTGTKHL